MKRFSVAAALLAASALLGTDARAQTGTARGKIVDEKGQALQGATIAIEYEGSLTRRFETKTNKKGEYTQVGLPVGDYKITATKDGYQGAYLTLHIGLGDATQVPELKLLSAEAARAEAQKAAGGPSAAEISSAFKAAYDLTQEGKLDEAEAAYKGILAKSPDIPEVHYNLAFIHVRRKDHAAAEASYRKALELKPDYGDAVVALAEMYQASGAPAQAAEVLAKAIADFPEDATILFGAAVFHFNTGRAAEAIEGFKKCLQLDASKSEAHYYLGSLSVGQNDIPGALEHLEAYLASSPTNAQFKATAEALVQYLKTKK